MARKIRVRGSEYKPVERVLARHSSWDEVDVSGSKWNHLEALGSKRSSFVASAEVLLEASTDVLLEASTEVLVEASTEASTGNICGSFQSHRISNLSIASMEASIAPTEAPIAQGNELRCRWKLPQKLCKLLEASMEAKKCPIEVVEASNKMLPWKRPWKLPWKRPFTSAKAVSMEESTEAVEAMEASMKAAEAPRHSLAIVEVIFTQRKFSEANGSISCSSEASMEASTGHVHRRFH